MKASFKRRLGAYLIDIILLGMVLMIVYTILPEGQNIHALNQEMNEITELALNQEISFGTYLYRYANVIHDLDTERALYSVINAFLIIGYFIAIPYFQDGQTLGKKVFNIKVKRNDGELIALNDLLLRSLIIHGLGYMMVSLACIYILPAMPYFIVTTIFGFIQIFLVILCLLMVLYRKDKRGLHDMIAKTSVVVVK